MSRRLLLVVGGGIAAYKALELVRLARGAGWSVTPVLTAAGAQFVTPLSLGALAESPVYTDLFSLKDEVEMGHIRLAREADVIAVVPATADLMARAALGLANDLATTLMLAARAPMIWAPAMNWAMWDHPATRGHAATLAARGMIVLEPDEGPMACGEQGVGRLPDPARIWAAIEGAAQPAQRPLAGRRALVTAGPTHEPIDPVRYLANRSSGRQGFALAEALAALGAEVTLVAGPVALSTPRGVRRVDVETAAEMAAAAEAALPVDVAVLVAAVADWAPRPQRQKLKKAPGARPPEIELLPTPDILAAVARPGPRRPRLVVGFAAETERLEDHARAKLDTKGCDWIVANDVSDGVMGGEHNRIVLLAAGRPPERWAEQPKTEVAQQLAARIAEALGNG